MSALQALLFDVDGTLAETEEGHRQAFNATFAAFGMPWVWRPDDYRELLRVAGGKERMLHYARSTDPQGLAALEARLGAMHEAKNRHYAEWMGQGGGALRPGARRLIDEALSRGVRLAIVTTTSRANVEALLEAALGPAGETLFEIIVSGEDVTKKKPDPEAYLIALERLQLPPASCLAFEDSRNGLLAARAAGLRTVVTPSLYSAHEDFREATLVARHLDHGPEGTPLTVETLAALV